ncbi:gephyrin-like molybdotransferase Glp [Desulfovibrio ferrophilus]|uniref:Molybdopterin molybdenumtransferase n=1 Tax=Desulfovibrio ferrophilus TaxID=241368 RepID=A0A2Z6B215_9BACT|nr:gephyrin-like molybdotransferase Glp [Desulfovibrio ferrophilus]BBD09470.1 molybdenum cofactor synthesis domain-containing protein [Desulfovibrio ferrophilus]
MKDGFFNVVSPVEFAALLANFPHLEAETVPLAEARGRVLVTSAVAPHDLPLVNRSCMDGFALSARDAFGASEANPAYLDKVGDLAIDEPVDVVLEPGQCVGIVTGGTLPESTDAVVMVEHTGDLGAGTIEIRKSSAPGDNVMRRGEDATSGETALGAGTVLRPQEIGLLAALGFAEVMVYRRPRCGIISTGDELVPVTETPRPGQVRDVNSHALAALIAVAGGTPTLYGLVPDQEQALVQAVARAVDENDMVFISGGSSMGVRDLTQAVIEVLPDSEILAHGVAVSPGKPTILARVGRKAVWGLPGQVTSAQVVMLVFGCPYLRHVQGEPEAFDVSRRRTFPARLARNIHSKPGREDYVRVRLEAGEAHPVLGKSGLLRTMILADGLVCIPADSEGLEAGTLVDVWLLS